MSGLRRAAWFPPRDDRRDPLLAGRLAPALLAHARRTCYLIGEAAIAARDAGRVRLHRQQYGGFHGLCADDPFWCQPTVVERGPESYGAYGYTGYLLDARTVLSCWHGWAQAAAQRQVAVFDYVARSACDDPTELPADRVLGVELLPAARPPEPGLADRNDWVLLRLERPVTHLPRVTPPALADARAGRRVYTLGHPHGLPLKLTGGGRVLASDRGLLRTDLDTFDGNSGSPVFDARSHALVGVAVAGQEGESDFVADVERGCYVSNRVAGRVTGQTAVAAACFRAALRGERAQGST